MRAREFNLKAYAAITWHNDSASLGLEPRLADHRSQAARTATLPIAPPGQARDIGQNTDFSYHFPFNLPVPLEALPFFFENFNRNCPSP